MSVYERYEMVLGLEVHAQLLTRTKLFSPMEATFGAEPNSRVNPICAGLPGVLPVLNRRAVAYAIRAGLALGCEIRGFSQFARKNYFYPDLPKGYQISQFELPLCEHGTLTYPMDGGGERTCGITRIHMEEDAGKLIHVSGESVSHVDLNRAGVPLIEIVSEPDIRSPDEAVGYLKEIRNILMYLGICDGNMEEGSLRCDANISVRERGATELGTKVELKNMNSFKFLKDAVIYEFHRQVDRVSHGEPIVQESRLWRTEKRRSESMRRKEESDDYRYFPDPDLPPLIVSDAWIEEERAQLVELPASRRRRYQSDFNLPTHDTQVLTQSRFVANYFEAAVAQYDNPKGISNWLMTSVLGELKSPEDILEFNLTAAYLAELVRLIDTGDISGTIAKQVFRSVVESGDSPAMIIERDGLKVVRDTGAIEALVDDIIARHPEQVAQFRAGKTKVLGFFVGQVMRATKGKADPKLVNQTLREKLAP